MVSTAASVLPLTLRCPSVFTDEQAPLFMDYSSLGGQTLSS